MIKLKKIVPMLVIIISVISIVSMLSGSKDVVSVEDYSARVEDAVRQIDDPNLVYHEPVEQEDGSHIISLNDNGDIGILIDADNEEYKLVITSMEKISMGDNSFRNALALLVGTVDDSLSMGDRELLLREMGIVYDDLNTENYYGAARKNEINYNFTYALEHGVVLEARK